MQPLTQVNNSIDVNNVNFGLDYLREVADYIRMMLKANPKWKATDSIIVKEAVAKFGELFLIFAEGDYCMLHTKVQMNFPNNKIPGGWFHNYAGCKGLHILKNENRSFARLREGLRY